MLPLFAVQMVVGSLCGYLLGRGLIYLINKIKLEYDGLYPVLTLSAVLLIYSLTTKLGGNGFLAIYITGLVLRNNSIAQKRYLVHFHGGLAWLMQIAMFLTLGLLVFPSKLLQIAAAGLVTALFLVFIARPLAVFLTLAPARYTLAEKTFVSWVGLRGSVPIILATFPLIAGLPNAALIFNIVFFAVLVSVLLQGTTIPLVAKFLGLDAPLADKRKYPLELDQADDMSTKLIDFTVPYGSWMSGRTVSEVGLPQDSLITLVARNEDFIVPSGKTTIESGDVLLILVNSNNLFEIQQILSKQRQ
jgi:cell volume regulation protein A